MSNGFAHAVELLRSARRLAVLTGAGISAESGVPTFRGSSGLWEGQSVYDVASPEGFGRDPALVWRFYNQRRANLVGITPNAGHRALVELEQRFGDAFALITQNIDNLHRAAGSNRIHELHGNIQRIRCSKSRCEFRADRGLEPLDELPRCPQCGHLARPDIVWFGEMLPPEVWIAAEEAVVDCDVFLVVGTSAIVYPAAGLIEVARNTVGASVIEVNLAETDASKDVTVGLYGPAGTLLPELVAQAFSG